MALINFLLAYLIILAPLFALIILFVSMELHICRQGGEVYPWTAKLDRCIKHLKRVRER